MVTLEVLNPCGTVRSSLSFAPRLGELGGKTIGMLSNTLGEADRTFPFIHTLLERNYPTATIIPYSEFPVGGDRIDSEEIVGIVKSRGCQAVIVGNAQ
jgi:hypothetical protein